MSFLQDITPINLLEEKEKFLVDPTTNPQFIYKNAIDTEKLHEYGKPQKKYIDLAKAILEKTYFGRNEQDLYMSKGKQLTQDQVHRRIRSFLEIHQLEDRFSLIWSSSFVSRTTISSDTIKLRLPADFRQEDLLGMLYHEIGTHAIRRINYEQQPWFKKKKKYGFSGYLKTEEGIASLHSLIPHSYKSAFISAIRYLAADASSRGSFVETWEALSPYVEDHNRRWTIVFRQKRGLTDTSRPGGYTKDLVYFEGLVDVWRWLYSQNFALADLYYGKLALEDIPKAVSMYPEFDPLLPSFYTHNFTNYRKQMLEIGEYNLLDQF
ncbi:MAG: DUF1704 domain-containing protein [Pseudomonadales bacterium]|nr:DUF1704 domain-containing protein [Candidatus Woesebacteria bacterium]MCB9800585.1 DUF1704 domain-containing protein [Pseudomonadales bacterium]